MAKSDKRKLRASLDDGFTPIPNLLLEALMAAHFTGAENRIIQCLLRQTYGYANGREATGRRSAWRASLREWAQRTGLHRQTICTELGRLERAAVVHVQREGGRSPVTVSINRDVHQWRVGTASQQAKYRARLQELQSRSLSDQPAVHQPLNRLATDCSSAAEQRVQDRTNSTFAGRLTDKGRKGDNHAPSPQAKESLKEDGQKRGHARAKHIIDSCLQGTRYKPTEQQVLRLAEVLRDERPDESITKRATAKARDRLASDPSFAWFAYLCQAIRGMVADQRGEQRERGLTEQRERARREQAQREAQKRREDDRQQQAAFEAVCEGIRALPSEEVEALRQEARRGNPLLLELPNQSRALWAEMIRVHRQRVGPGGADGQGSEAQ